MMVTIQRAEIDGTAKAPASKSFTHRALITAALADGTSRIENPLTSYDTEATSGILRALGVAIEEGKKGWLVNGGHLKANPKELYCNESGTTMRFVTAICTSVEGRCKITGAPQLLRRPIGDLVGALRQLGARCSSNGDFPPVVTEDSLIGGKASIRGDISSQFVSALLLVAPLAQNPVTVELSTALESLPYVNMTMSSQKLFGVEVKAGKGMTRFEIEPQKYKPATCKVEGDWSSAAFLLALGALAGKTKVTGLNTKSLQADRSIMDILDMMGAEIKAGKDSITVQRSSLRPIEFDVSDCPDLFPILCVLCSAAKGRSRITGIERLKIKESDRVSEMEQGLLAMGIDFARARGAVEIIGGKAKGAVINSDDHRIAMSFGVLGTIADGKTVVKNAECVEKSFPEFWNNINRLGAKLEMVR